MVHHSRHYRGELPSQISQGAFPLPEWAHDKKAVEMVQKELLKLRGEGHTGINLGSSGIHGDGVDGDYREKTASSFASITPDEQQRILSKIGVNSQPQASTNNQPIAPSLPPVESSGRAASGGRSQLRTATANPAASGDPESVVNQAILNYTRQHQGTHYDFEDQNGGVNCSTFTARATTFAARTSRTTTFADHSSDALLCNVNGTSEQQILAASGASENTRLGFFRRDDLLNGNTLSQLHPGMMIGMAFDHHSEGYENGRANRIVHIGVVVKDEHGNLSVAASDGGRGVGVYPIQEWIRSNTADDPTGARFYVAQPFKALAQAPEPPHPPEQPHYAAAANKSAPAHHTRVAAARQLPQAAS